MNFVNRKHITVDDSNGNHVHIASEFLHIQQLYNKYAYVNKFTKNLPPHTGD